MKQKPLTEVLARVHVAEKYRLDPSETPWENMSDERRSLELGAMHEVVETMNMFGWDVVMDDGKMFCRRKKTPAEFAREHTDELDPMLTRSEIDKAKSPPKGILVGDICGICGQPSIIRESSCRTRCKSCGAIEGGGG